MASAPELPGSDWSARLASMIAGEVRRRREQKGMSAQQLSDACARLGLPIHRSVLANFENGRRPTISVAELLIIGRALEIAPILLLFPVGYADRAEMLPDVFCTPLSATKWVAGDDTDRRGTSAPPQELSDYQLVSREEQVSETIHRHIRFGHHLPEKVAELGRDAQQLEAEYAEHQQRLESLRADLQRLSESREANATDLAEVTQSVEDEEAIVAALERRARWAVSRFHDAEGWTFEVPSGSSQQRQLARLRETRNEMRARGMLLPPLPNDVAQLFGEELTG